MMKLLRKGEKINDVLRSSLGESISNLRISFNSFEISTFEPQNKNVAKQMEKQMEAERARRENDYNTQAHIRTAEGYKQSEILKADGVFYASQKTSDAEKYIIDTSTVALVNRVNEIRRIMPNLTDQEISTIVLEERRLEHLKELAQNQNGKTTYFIDPKGMFPSLKALFDYK